MDDFVPGIHQVIAAVDFSLFESIEKNSETPVVFPVLVPKK